jgi:hypothetical protein
LIQPFKLIEINILRVVASVLENAGAVEVEIAAAF